MMWTKPVLELYSDIVRLKELERSGWKNRGVPAAETVAEHSYGVAAMALCIAASYRPDLDPFRVAALGIVHDMPESSEMGDPVPGQISPEEKARMEAAYFQKRFSQFPNPEFYKSLWREFQDGSSAEARFVKQVDKLETAMQARHYEKRGFQRMRDFYPYAMKELEDETLIDILSAIIND